MISVVNTITNGPTYIVSFSNESEPSQSGLKEGKSYMNPPQSYKIVSVLIGKYFFLVIRVTAVRSSDLLWQNCMCYFTYVTRNLKKKKKKKLQIT